MRYCQSCGAGNGDDSRFCARCGTQLADVVAETDDAPSSPPPPLPPPPPPAPPEPPAPALATSAVPPATATPTDDTRHIPVIPPAAPESPKPALSVPPIDLAKVLTGDWKGAALVGLAGFLTPAVLAVALVGLLHPNDASFKQFLIASTLVLASAFGGDIVAEPDSGGYATSIGAYPLTLTLASLLVAGWLFRRQVSRYTALAPAIMHALRASLIFAVLMFVPAVALRGDLRMPVGYSLGQIVQSGDFGAHLPALAALSFTFMFLTLAAVLLLRADWLPAQARLVRDWLATPISAVLVMVGLCVVVGIAVAIGVFAVADKSHNTTAVAEFIATLPNLGVLGVLAGGGVALGSTTSSTDNSIEESEFHHLAYLADHSTNWAWLLPIGTLLVFAGGALWVVRRSSTAKALTNNLLAWVAASALALPLLAHFSGVHVHAEETGKRNPESAHVFGGAVTWQALLLALFASFVCAVVATALARGRTEPPSGHAPPSPPTYFPPAPEAPAPPTGGWGPSAEHQPPPPPPPPPAPAP